MIPAEECVFIVTGSTVDAELADRPVAYALRELVEEALGRAAEEVGTTGGVEESEARGPLVVVCSDVWYLNQAECLGRPTIAVGPPGNNALAAYLGDRLEAVLSVKGQFVVQMDPTLEDLTVSCWGGGADATAAAARAFSERYLGAWTEEVARRQTPAGG